MIDKRPYIAPTTSRALASTLGTLPASIFATVVIARSAPDHLPAAFGLAYALWLPLWLTAMCWVACARGARPAWLRVLALTGLAAIAAYLH